MLILSDEAFLFFYIPYHLTIFSIKSYLKSLISICFLLNCILIILLKTVAQVVINVKSLKVLRTYKLNSSIDRNSNIKWKSCSVELKFAFGFESITIWADPNNSITDSIHHRILTFVPTFLFRLNFHRTW